MFSMDRRIVIADADAIYAPGSTSAVAHSLRPSRAPEEREIFAVRRGLKNHETEKFSRPPCPPRRPPSPHSGHAAARFDDHRFHRAPRRGDRLGVLAAHDDLVAEPAVGER